MCHHVLRVSRVIMSCAFHVSSCPVLCCARAVIMSCAVPARARPLARYRRRQLLRLWQDDGRLFWVDIKEAARNAHCLLLSHNPVKFAAAYPPQMLRRADTSAVVRTNRRSTKRVRGHVQERGQCGRLPCPFANEGSSAYQQAQHGVRARACARVRAAQQAALSRAAYGCMWLHQDLACPS